jgi:5-bromo-4-chloroindolyl phosphate hydrolysis protein
MAVRLQKPPGHSVGSKGLLLLLLPLPVLLAAILSLAKGNLPGVIANALGYALFLGGALLTRRGLYREAKYQRHKIALAPRYPLKTLGAVTIAVATGITATFAARYSLAIGVCFGLGALLGCYLVYGFDPRVAKRAMDVDGLDATGQVQQALEQADKTIAAIEKARQDIRNAELRARLDRITALARQILKVLEENPQHLRRARKFLTVYLEGAQQVTDGYGRTHQQVQSQALEANFRHVLATIEEVFKEQQQKLLENDVLDLDVKIEVLNEQLKREGVT